MSVYNGEKHVAETIDSILVQEGVELEFVIVNDGSTDRSSDILHQYATRDPRLRVLAQENQGLTTALIVGCSEARANYIARQDVGDVSLPGRLVRQFSALESSKELSFVSSWTEFTGPNWEHLRTDRGTGKAIEPENVWAPGQAAFLDGPTHHGSVMFRVSAYERAGGYRWQFFLGQDWDLWRRLAVEGRFQSVQKVLYRARVFPDGLSLTNRVVQKQLSQLSKKACELMQESGDFTSLLEQASNIKPDMGHASSNRRLAKGHYFVGEALRRNQDPRALGYLRRAIELDPLLVRARVRLLQTLTANWH